MFSLRSMAVLLCFVFVGFCGWSLYLYFCDTTPAILQLQGIIAQNTYANDISCSITSDKKGEISIMLDDVSLARDFHIAAYERYSFLIPTKTVSNGQHVLKASLIDTRFSKNQSLIETSFFVDNQSLQAVVLKPEDVLRVFQGRTLRIQVQVNKQIESIMGTFLSQKYNFFPESEHGLVYETYIPIDCQEAANEYLATIAITDKVGTVVTLETKVQIVAFPFKKHTLQVSDQKMEEEEQLGADNQAFENKMIELSKNSIKKKLWKGIFCLPMDFTKITCEFGTIRTTQKKGRYAHRAIDAISAPRSVVWAPQNGIVVLKERFAFTGNTVVIDHGYGVLSMFCHLDSFSKINVGDSIVQGNPIGTMGKTGYATGYHLHWEMRIGNVPVDPLQWTRASFQSYS